MIGTTDLEDQATTTSTGGRTPIFSPERAARQGDQGLFSRVRGPGLGPTRGRASWADRDHRAIAPLWRTADWGHLRLHHGHAPWGRYDWGCLTYWAGLIAETFTNAEDVFVYFNNDRAVRRSTTPSPSPRRSARPGSG